MAIRNYPNAEQIWPWCVVLAAGRKRYSIKSSEDRSFFFLHQKTILPDTIQPNMFTNLASDNIDCLEETLTGKGTTHRLNGIVVQPTVYGPHLPCAELPAIAKRKQQSITHEVQPLARYIAGKRAGPNSISVVEDTNSLMKEAKKHS